MNAMAIVTGAASGIGRACGLGFVEQGSRDVAIFLASDAARFITGDVIEVNGGFYFDWPPGRDATA